MTKELAAHLRELADKYEVASFCDEDPSQFLRWYDPASGRGTIADVEVASFIAAMLAFGNRKQFIPKVRQILETSDRSLGSVTAWLKAGAYCDDFPHGEKKFYRFYSYDDMQIFFGELGAILKEAGSLGSILERRGVLYVRIRSLSSLKAASCYQTRWDRIGVLGAKPLGERVARNEVRAQGKTFPSCMKLFPLLFQSLQLCQRGGPLRTNGSTCFCAGW